MDYDETSAAISNCGQYRYSLYRQWGQLLRMAPPKACTFVMLNPSTADGTEDDPTLRRCVNFANIWGCDSLTVVNLFAYRATNPEYLAFAADPCGPDNITYLTNAIENADVLMAGWGSNPLAVEQWQDIIKPEWAKRMMCFNKNKDGMPKHPLYVKNTAELRYFVE